LSERLKELEAEGIVVRTVVPETPVRIDYHLTDKGNDLQAVIDEIANWAYRWPSDDAPDAAESHECAPLEAAAR
jgi:DNA-binding HxlR family transcriptional regulator